MALETRIRWRKWPEEKPPSSGWCVILTKSGIIGREPYYPDSDSWAAAYSLLATHGIEVTHFALPSDITMKESE